MSEIAAVVSCYYVAGENGYAVRIDYKGRHYATLVHRHVLNVPGRPQIRHTTVAGFRAAARFLASKLPGYPVVTFTAACQVYRYTTSTSTIAGRLADMLNEDMARNKLFEDRSPAEKNVVEQMQSQAEAEYDAHNNGNMPYVKRDRELAEWLADNSIGKAVLFIYPRNYWGVAEFWEDGKLVRRINKFYEVSDEWIKEFDASGGTGTGYQPGELLWKYNIADLSYERITVPDHFYGELR